MKANRNTYTPRRASKRWLDGAPSHVLDCFRDKRTGSFTVLYTGVTLYPQEGRDYANCRVAGREMSSEPCHPQGVGLWFDYEAHVIAGYRYRVNHTRIKWNDLPEPVKRCVIQDGRVEA